MGVSLIIAGAATAAMTAVSVAVQMKQMRMQQEMVQRAQQQFADFQSRQQEIIAPSMLTDPLTNPSISQQVESFNAAKEEANKKLMSPENAIKEAEARNRETIRRQQASERKILQRNKLGQTGDLGEDN